MLGVANVSFILDRFSIVPRVQLLTIGKHYYTCRSRQRWLIFEDIHYKAKVFF